MCFWGLIKIQEVNEENDMGIVIKIERAIGGDAINSVN